jgi:two-component system, cell cycle sensor histidine kinase and response regulator CckA
MPQGGRLTVEASNLDVPPSVVQGIPVQEGPYVAISVRDTGTGMDAATQQRIFEPFFTTKLRGKGSGLGLATVYGIVKQSGGYIWVESEPGRGSTFTLWLPRSFSEPDEVQDARAPSRLAGTETILLVEDEDGMREVVRELLEELGYRVLEAASGSAALELVRSHQGRIQLLFTDVIMQHMNGRELAEQVVQLRPETKVLFMSGYADDAIRRYGMLEPGISLLQKPFSSSELARRIRELLDAGATAAPARAEPPAPGSARPSAP